MYGGGAYYPDPSQTAAPFAAVMSPPGLVRARALAWLETVAAHPEVDATRVAAIGYCFGGKCVLELARSGADVKAVVSYHGLLTTDLPAAKGVIKGEVVAYCGRRDPYAPPEHIEGLRAELEAAAARHQITIFSEAAHSFTIPDAEKSGLAGVEYHELSDRIAWAGTVALLEATLGRK
jgi:dienelactone hydrolase